MRRALAVIVLAASPFAAPTVDGSQAADRAGLARAGLTDLQRAAPSLDVDLRYAGPHNLTGRRLPGYCRPWAYLRSSAARDLARVQRSLRRRGLGLSILDAYRPARPSHALVAWARRAGRPELIGTYLAVRSRHNQGTAVDLTLIRLRDDRGLPMGTRYDHLGPRANTLNASGRCCATGWCSRGRCRATALRTTGASGGTSSTARRPAAT